MELPDEYDIHATFNVADLTLFESAAERPESEDEACRLMAQPSQGGGDATVMDPSILTLVKLPQSPIPKKSLKKYSDGLYRLLRTWEDQSESLDDLNNSTESLSNFNKFIKARSNVLTLIELEDIPMG